VGPFSVAFKSAPEAERFNEVYGFLALRSRGASRAWEPQLHYAEGSLRAAASADRNGKVDVRYSIQLTWINVI
jgi:hypothetical protein